MGKIFSSVRRIFSEKSSKGRVVGIKPRWSGKAFDFMKAMEREKEYTLFEKYYKLVPLINATINYTADMTTGAGFHLVSENEQSKKEIEEFMIEFDVASIIHKITRQLLIYGNAYLEIVKTGMRISDLKLLHPKTMTIETDKFGTIQQYIQQIDREQITFKPDEIAHFKWNIVGDSPYGTSAIATVVGSTKIKLSMEYDLKLIAHRYAAPQVHYKVGTDEFPAADSAIDELENDLQAIHPEMDLVTDHTIDAKVIRPLGRDIGVEGFVEHTENQVVTGMQVPEVVLGRGKGATEATANVQLEAFDRRVKSLQRIIKKEVEVNLFDIVVVPGEVHLEFGELEKEDEDIIVNRLLRLKAAGIVSADYVAKELGIDKKWIPEEPEEPQDGGDKALKGLDDTKKDVNPHKEPVAKDDKKKDDKKKGKKDRSKIADSNEQWRLNQ